MDDKKKSADILVGRGLLLYREGEVKRAIRLWRSALDLVPDHPEARRFLLAIAEKHSSREARTERIDSAKLKQMLAECRPTGSHDAATADEAADEFYAKTQPVVPEELIEQAAQSWVDSPEDNLEITIDDHLVTDQAAEEEVDLLEQLSSGTVSLEEWADSRSPVPGEDELPITVEEPIEEGAPEGRAPKGREDPEIEIVVSEAKKPRR
jgi:hypothetical protein